MNGLYPAQWIAQCTERLKEHWQTVEPTQFEGVAVDLWCDLRLRAMQPMDAVAQSLSPLTDGSFNRWSYAEVNIGIAS